MSIDDSQTVVSRINKKEMLNGWFQVDSATAQTACKPMQALSDVFGNRIISSDIWPARSPYLNPRVSSSGVI
jgi:hypothetical protein